MIENNQETRLSQRGKKGDISFYCRAPLYDDSVSFQMFRTRKLAMSRVTLEMFYDEPMTLELGWAVAQLYLFKQNMSFTVPFTPI